MEYDSYEEIVRKLTELQRVHSDIVTLEAIGESYEHRSIFSIKISGKSKQRAKILFSGGIHGNEKIGVSMILRLIEVLAHGYGNDRRVRNLIDKSDIYLIPVINPDGYSKSRRTNARGVDLNRNYEVGSARRGILDGWKRWPFYPGESPYSEPETRAVCSLIKRVKFSVAVSFHSTGGVIGYSHGYTRKKARDFELLKSIAVEMRDRQPLEKYVVHQQSWLYRIKGCLEDELFDKYGTLAFVIELMRYRRLFLKPNVMINPFRWFNPTETNLAKHLENNIGLSLYLLEIAANPRKALSKK